MAIHQVGHHTTCSLWQVVGILLDNLVEGLRFDENHLLSVGRELISLNTGFVVSELAAVGTVGIHAPQLSTAQVGNALAAFNPCGVSLIL